MRIELNTQRIIINRMYKETNISPTQLSFTNYLFNNKINRRIGWFAAAALILQFAIFKYFYPYGNFIHDDSFIYIETAYKNLDINSYLVGYSRFLRLISVFTTYDLILFFIQYILIQISALLFLTTLFYLFNPSKLLQISLLCFVVFNPLFLHLANLVSSDGFFLALSLIWFSLLLHIIKSPSRLLILLQSLVLFIAFTVRYNALIYPFITIVAFSLSPQSLKMKILSVLPGIMLCGLSIFYTSYKYKKLTGFWQYAPFSGWQIANNTMYAYRYINPMDRKVVPNRFKVLDSNIRIYFDSTRDVSKHPQEGLLASTFYMWDRTLPLYKFRDAQFTKDSSASDLKKWASMGPLYKDYGLFLLKQYPAQFAKYYLWPNANKYYAPPIEFLESYNGGKDSAVRLSSVWFGYSKVTTRFKDKKIKILDFYPFLSGIMNLLFICGLTCFKILNRFTSKNIFSKSISLVSVFWIINAFFSIFSTAAALRFLAFPIVLMTAFAFIIIDQLYKMSIKTEIKSAHILRPENIDLAH